MLHSIAAYITRLLDTFGCVSLGDPIGFPADAASSSAGGDREEMVMPFIDVISQLRQEIRKKATELKNSDLFKLCDSIRDDVLPNLGVRMEDYNAEDGQLLARVKLVDKEILLREREEKIQLERLKQQEKEAKKNAAAAKVVEPPIAPSEFFRKEVGKYSQFADNGMPTHDQEGKELTKTALKKIAKVFEAQEKKYNAYLKSIGASKWSSFISILSFTLSLIFFLSGLHFCASMTTDFSVFFYDKQWLQSLPGFFNNKVDNSIWVQQ